MSTPLSPFADGAAARAALSGLPVTDPIRTHEALGRFYAQLTLSPLPVDERIALLEDSETELLFVQDDATRRLRHKPVPYTGGELSLFLRIVALWQAVGEAWSHCLPERSGGGLAPDTQLHVLERIVHFRGMVPLEYLKARCQVPADAWRLLNRAYAEGERRGWAETVYLDAQGRKRSCARSYLPVLLFDLAKPYGLTSRDMAWVLRWARLMAKLAHIVPVPVPPPPFLLDLDSDCPVRTVLPGAQLGSQVRALEVADLAKHLHKVRHGLAKGLSPETLLLGDDCSPADATRLMTHLKCPWSLSAIARPFSLKTPAGTAEVLLGFEAIHVRLTGRELLPASRYENFSRKDADRVFIFGEDPGAGQTNLQDQLSQRFPGETWSLLEATAQAFRLYRAGGEGKVALGQLLAVRQPGLSSWWLCRVSSLMQTEDGGVVIKARRFLGDVTGITASATGGVAAAHPVVLAFALRPPHSASPVPELVLPRGWFQLQRPVELAPQPNLRCHLERVLLDGYDFDLVACQA